MASLYNLIAMRHFDAAAGTIVEFRLLMTTLFYLGELHCTRYDNTTIEVRDFYNTVEEESGREKFGGGG